jgi:hypothetical protein
MVSYRREFIKSEITGYSQLISLRRKTNKMMLYFKMREIIFRFTAKVVINMLIGKCVCRILIIEPRIKSQDNLDKTQRHIRIHSRLNRFRDSLFCPCRLCAQICAPTNRSLMKCARCNKSATSFRCYLCNIKSYKLCNINHRPGKNILSALIL